MSRISRLIGVHHRLKSKGEGGGIRICDSNRSYTLVKIMVLARKIIDGVKTLHKPRSCNQVQYCGRIIVSSGYNYLSATSLPLIHDDLQTQTLSKYPFHFPGTITHLVFEQTLFFFFSIVLMISLSSTDIYASSFCRTATLSRCATSAGAVEHLASSPNTLQ